MLSYDVAVVGGGPAGAVCAAFCAQGGLRTLLLERAIFPRGKVCGDCVNAGCWPIFERLGVAERVLAQPHARLAQVAFVNSGGRVLRYPLDKAGQGEIAIKRSLLDAVLLERASELGAEICEDTTLMALGKDGEIQTSRGSFCAQHLVAADGRNSTVARLRGLLPAAEKDRVGLQAHLPAPAGFGESVEMHFLPCGYGGVASIGAGEINLCLVARPEELAALKAWAAARFGLGADQAWRTITPLARRPVPSVQPGLLLVGDAARVVEPFTGEGIYYAAASGELAARHLIVGDPRGYAAAHADLYRGRLWPNQLAKAAVLHPWAARAALAVARVFPGVLGFLTTKVMREPSRRSRQKAL